MPSDSHSESLTKLSKDFIENGISVTKELIALLVREFLD
jgi:hypothetical protein